MYFKKFRGRIFDVELSKAEKKVLDEKVNEYILMRHREFQDDFDYMILNVLHDYLDLSPAQLREVYDRFVEGNEELIERYEFNSAGVYIARREMNALGCNIEEWNKERRLKD